MPDADLALLRRMADAVAQVVETSPPETWGDELRIGADGTPTKRIDELAEQALMKLLDETKGLDLLSEEAGHIARGGDRVLVVDPIDGTTNAVRGIPFYCVSLAIGTRTLSDVECGLVMNLCTGDVFEATRGGGARLNGKPIRVRVPRKGRVYATSSLAPEEVPHARGIPAASGYPDGRAPPVVIRSFGASALEMCLVAQGALDGYHYAKPILRIIDVAASTLIVREAGGIVLGPDGRDLDLPLSLAPRFGLTAASSRAVASDLGVDG